MKPLIFAVLWVAGFFVFQPSVLRAQQNAFASLRTLQNRFPTRAQVAQQQKLNLAEKQGIHPQGLIQVFSGYFSNERSIENGKGRVSLMVCLPVWQHRKGEHWMYFTRLFVGAEDKPFMQYLYKFETIGKDSVVATMFTLTPADAVLHRFAWLDKNPLEGLIPEQLVDNIQGRLLVTEKNLTNGFFIRPEGESCSIRNPETNVAGFYLRMFVQAAGVESSVRFLDKNNQVVFDNQNQFYERIEGENLKNQLRMHINRTYSSPATSNN